MRVLHCGTPGSFAARSIDVFIYVLELYFVLLYLSSYCFSMLP